jgi:hypothetical protein
MRKLVTFQNFYIMGISQLHAVSVGRELYETLEKGRSFFSDIEKRFVSALQYKIFNPTLQRLKLPYI